MTFDALRLAEPIRRAVATEGYSTATPIQSQTIPHALAGRDVLGCAQTGTGKTAAFALPVLHRLAEASEPKGGRKQPRCLVLCPTRELASQIADSFTTYGKHLPLRHAVIFGGVNQNPQVRALRGGVDIIVATPGRLLDLMNQGHVDLRGIETLVLDEADRMLDMGFIHDIERIVEHVPAERQTLLFSATMPREIRRLADRLLDQPATVDIAPATPTVEAIDQSVYFVMQKRKAALLADLLAETSITRALVFTRTKHGADRVVRHLYKAGTQAEAIHGNKTQNARERALAKFRSGRTHVLVATDIAARGIDVDDISHVINFDLTHEPETYVHRIGRTARAGASGVAVSFCDPGERGNLHAIQRLIRKDITVCKDRPEYAPSEAEQAATATQSNRSGRSTKRSSGRPRGNGASGGSSRQKPQRGGRSSNGSAAASSHSQGPRRRRRSGGRSHGD